jgi:ABC-type transporter Mla MlaB component
MHLAESLHQLFRAKPQERQLPSWITSIDNRQGVMVVRLGPEVDRVTEGEISDKSNILNAMPDAWEHSVVFDFAQTCDVDFTTVAFLVLALRMRVPTHAKIAIINPPAKLRDLIGISRLGDTLPEFASEDEAVNALSG